MTEEKKDKLVQLEKTGEIELPKLDLTKYVGKKMPITAVTEHEGEYGYYIKVATDIIETVEFGEKMVDLQATRVFGLHQDKDGNIGWGKDTKLGLFLKKMNVKHYIELVGKEVIVQTQTNKEGTDFLTFN